MDVESIPAAERNLKTAEVARVLGVSVRAVRAWADAGKIACYRTFGGHRLFPLSEVERVRGLLFGLSETGAGAGSVGGSTHPLGAVEGHPSPRGGFG